ncbi:MAG TPA: hypothetical protein VHD36_08425 [Pirellulales bacterium]|nr:hypothetical protein [Pirellulales bacterium]
MNDLMIHFSIVAFLLLAAAVLRAPQQRGRFVDYGRRRLERAAEARARRQVAQFLRDAHVCELLAAALSAAQLVGRWLLSWLGNASLALVVATAAVAETPPAAARAALADLQTQPIERRANLRYLVVEQPGQVVAVNYVLNAISRSRLIVRAEAAGPHLLRIDLAALANPRDAATFTDVRAAWEKLVAVDPYFHLRTQVVPPQVQSSAAASHPAKHAARAQPLRVETVTVDGGWIPADVASGLKSSSLSAGAVLRADFFIARATVAPLYYDFAGIPATETALLARLGIDRGTVDRLAADTAANLFISRVTNKPRRLVRLPGPLGGTWFSRDVEVETPDRDPLRNPVNYHGPAGTQAFRYDASEWFAQKENRFWLTAVYDARGQRQDTVKDAIAKDTLAHDGVVRPLVSCVRCHELNGGSAGMQPIVDDQFALLTGEAAVLRSFVPDVARRVAELYDPARLARDQARDREDYQQAVVAATGASPHDAASALARTYGQFVDRPVTLSIAATECGVGEAQFVMATRHSHDPAILALRAGREIRRATYEASFAELMLLTTQTRSP